MGVFQIESRAQMQMLKGARPESLDDLTVQVARVRPGPIQGGAVHPYIERRKALRADPSYEVPYDPPSLEPVLRDTLGAIVFQDQVIEVAMAFAGFSPGEAEGLRRAMSRSRSEAAMRSYERKFVAGAVARGVAREVAERVYSQIVGFSGLGFPKAHSAAFGLLAYQSTWLRVHYAPEFLCALLNEQPMGFYPPDTLVHESLRRGLEVLPPDVNASAVGCTVTDVGAIRLGLGYVLGVRRDEVEALVAERDRTGPFRSIEDLAARAGAGRPSLEHLAWSGACDALVAPPETGAAEHEHAAPETVAAEHEHAAAETIAAEHERAASAPLAAARETIAAHAAPLAAPAPLAASAGAPASSTPSAPLTSASAPAPAGPPGRPPAPVQPPPGAPAPAPRPSPRPPAPRAP